MSKIYEIDGRSGIMDEYADLYAMHVDHMTSESLHFKSSIAAELAYRDHRIRQLESPWVSVETRIPVFGEWCLGFTDGQVQMLFPDGIKDGNLIWLWMGDGDWEYPVSHWSKLPEPPAL